jgi:hypothetical protein
MGVLVAKRPAPRSDDAAHQVTPDEEGGLSPSMRELILRSKVEERRTRPDAEVEVAERRRRGDEVTDTTSPETEELRLGRLREPRS